MVSVSRFLTTLRTNNMLNSMTKEIGGSNIPHMVLVANLNECVDQAINQVGNTSIVFGGGYCADQVINRGFKALNPKHFQKHGFRSALSNRWFYLGKSLAIYSFVSSYVIASPFLRNYITLQRTQASNFAEVVGLSKDQRPKNKTELEAKGRYYRQRFAEIWGRGIGISALILAATYSLARQKTPFVGIFKSVDKLIGLPHGQYRHLKDLPAYLFWAIPAYVGLWKGSRDRLEKKETLFKAAGFGLAFIVLPRTVERLVQSVVKGKHFPIVGPGQNLAFLSQLVSGIVFYTSIPTIINLFKRKDRAAQYGLLNRA